MGVKNLRPFLQTTVGKKYLMGITGIIWALFVFAHMIGNFLIFDPASYNAYSHFLTKGILIYFVEAILIIAVSTHILLALSLTVLNRMARGNERYEVTASGEKKTSLISRTMGIQGSIILVFLISHIAMLKYGTYYETKVDGLVMRDIFRLVHETIKQPVYFAWYFFSIVLLGFHLSHGVQSIFQSFGLKTEKLETFVNKFSFFYALLVSSGFLVPAFYLYFFYN